MERYPSASGVGFVSGAVDWYQQNVGQCSAVLYQAMFIDSVNGAVPFLVRDF
jgi:hypothetical protein